MANTRWLDTYLEEIEKIHANESSSIIKFLRILFENSNFFEEPKELSKHFDELTELYSISIFAHEIFYLVNIYDQHNPSYFHSICLRILSFNCFNMLLDEESDKENDGYIKLLDLPMYWYTDHDKYIKEFIDTEGVVLYSSVLTALCLQLLNMESSTKHYETVKNFVKQHKEKKFAQNVLKCCFFGDEQTEKSDTFAAFGDIDCN